MDIFEQEISKYVWATKYRYQKDHKIFDHTIEDTWHRVARATASCEAQGDKKFWEKQFFSILENFNFLPGGRILAGAGVNRSVTLFNCFVMKIADDSLPRIFEALKEGALTLQQGGGIGYDFSILRPSGFPCDKSGLIASGPVSFMQIWDSMSKVLVSSSARRGAMMANLRCDHPDIMHFINIKADKQELRHFNLSVIINAEFMKAVKENREWPLVYPSKAYANRINCSEIKSKTKTSNIACIIQARELWENIIRSAYSYAEPGVIFEDTINEWNPLWYEEQISATNPCGEIPLPSYGACNLGSINLTRYIRNPYMATATIDWNALEITTEIATRFLDNVISISRYPLSKQKKIAMATRRIGLGFTGLANALLMLGIKYGSRNSLKMTAEITKKIAYTTWSASARLGKERGSFPLFKKQYLEGKFVLSLPLFLQKEILKNGMRNSHHNAIAPTGSISLLANNISSGIEPIFSKRYERNVLSLEGNLQSFTIEDYAIRFWRKKFGGKTTPPAWKEVNTLKPMDHLLIQAAIQPFIDNAISKTINVPVDFPLSQVMEIYSKAYDLGLKGCTIFRPNEITGSVLSQQNIASCCE